ncbi:unnamed protein product [Sphagnum jensenii]|uniref:Uncharacterized protein n=1 Tax=Sphagnum jensenii TaxID=128206 RepID=A0ABP0VMZ9_9BRYO
MNMTEPRQLIKPRSEQQAAAAAAVSLVKPIKASPRRPPLHMTEDALLAAVSKSAVAAKRSNTDEYPWSKKQRAAVLTTEPGSLIKVLLNMMKMLLNSGEEQEP